MISLAKRTFRILVYWLGFSSIYALFTVCPFCGRQACPAGIVSAGVVGSFFTFLLQAWKRLAGFFKQKPAT
jgi:tartrate dehydratase alpha subunit/fumarate hydratase class I-like protein